MPFVRILWKPESLDAAHLVDLRDASPSIVGEALEMFDPAHVVKPCMVDVRVEIVGALDLVHPDLLISVFARHEGARSAASQQIADQLTRSFRAIGIPPHSLVELVLSERASIFEYEDS